MVNFLSKELTSINKDYAERLIDEMRAGVDVSTAPKDLNDKQVSEAWISITLDLPPSSSSVLPLSFYP